MAVSFGIIGGGWRAEFFVRIAKDLPERFPLVGVVVRDPAKREAFQQAWQVPCFESTEQLIREARPGIAVTSVSWSSNLPLMEQLAAEGIPVLSETPIAPALEDLHGVYELERQGAKIQLAEQYIFQPMHAARLAVVDSGLLGPISSATVSCAHGYHGASLLRYYLQAGLGLPTISARKFTSKIVQSPGRQGPPKERKLVDSDRILAQFDYGDKLGVFDFTGDQYFSYFRSHTILVRGEQGEINNTTVRHLIDHQTPMQFDLTRQDGGHTGDLRGMYHRAIVGGGKIYFRNPFPGPRWMDDEIAVAISMAKMQEFVQGGPAFYGMADACHDRYLDILIGESISSGKPVTAEPQPWNG